MGPSQALERNAKPMRSFCPQSFEFLYSSSSWSLHTLFPSSPQKLYLRFMNVSTISYVSGSVCSFVPQMPTVCLIGARCCADAGDMDGRATASASEDSWTGGQAVVVSDRHEVRWGSCQTWGRGLWGMRGGREPEGDGGQQLRHTLWGRTYLD